MGGGFPPSDNSRINSQTIRSPSPTIPWSAPVKASSSSGRMENPGPPMMIGAATVSRIHPTRRFAISGYPAREKESQLSRFRREMQT